MIKDFKKYLNEVGFYNPYNDDKNIIVKKEPIMVSDTSVCSVYKQKQAFPTSASEVIKTPKGYSVYATEDFRKGDIIEIAPAILQSKSAYSLESLKDILFEIDEENGIYALVLGNGSLYASSKEPNVYYGWNKNNQCMYFVASKPISRGDEMTIDYGDKYWNERIPHNLQSDVISDVAKQELDRINIGELISKMIYNKSVR